jgi:hypothetical protein
MNGKYTLDDFIRKARAVHGDEYDYSLVEYLGSSKHVRIVCEVHKVFRMRPDKHLGGQGCKECAAIKRAESKRATHAAGKTVLDRALLTALYTDNHMTTKEISNLTGYGPTTVKRRLKEFDIKPLTITVRALIGATPFTRDHVAKMYFDGGLSVNQIAKEFNISSNYMQRLWGRWKLPTRHGKNRVHTKLTKTLLFKLYTRDHKSILTIAKATNNSQAVVIQALKNLGLYNDGPRGSKKLPHPFVCWAMYVEQRQTTGQIGDAFGLHGSTVGSILKRSGTRLDPQRYIIKESKGERQVRAFVRTLAPVYDKEQRVLKCPERAPNGQGIDVLTINSKAGFEFNGMYMHSEFKKTRTYHIDKTNMSTESDISLYHIWESEWLNKRPIVESMIRAKLGKTLHKIHARTCTVGKPSSKEARAFLEENHLQGRANASIRYGLYKSGELQALMTFQRDSKFGTYNLVRFCNKLNTSVVGGAQALMRAFERDYSLATVTTYANLRWGTGELYKQLGFTQIKQTPPTPWWTNNRCELYHHTHFRKYKQYKLLENFDPAQTEVQNMHNHGWWMVYDCGHLRFEKHSGKVCHHMA